MEYCEGGDLANHIMTKGALEGLNALAMIKGIVSAVSFLYDHNIIHRDIKPQNILLCKGEPKLADFGFAKELSHNKDVMQTGTNIGTILYMAPQLILVEGSNPHYSIKCDVWSVGVLMYFVTMPLCRSCMGTCRGGTSRTWQCSS